MRTQLNQFRSKLAGLLPSISMLRVAKPNSDITENTTRLGWKYLDTRKLAVSSPCARAAIEVPKLLLCLRKALQLNEGSWRPASVGTSGDS